MNENGIRTSRRSSSQRSIRDYPEHLNPFYEDENHKRLRFWKIGGEKPNRSNSFSIDGLKGLWSFKTFKLKKKSSALGINKTSESPPLLRRDEDRYGSQTTYDGRMRHTVDIGLENNFQRGQPYRSSLQDLNSVSRNYGENSFIRNNRYRSTVQASGGSQTNTPVFRSRYNQSSISRGSSQLSVNSTNPFENDDESISQIVSPDRTSIRQSGRKKRRAPQPPTSLSNTVTAASVEESSIEADRQNQSIDITNLTAEIESFVRTADTEKEEIDSKIEICNIHNENTDENKTRQSPESNDYYPQEDKFEEITVEKIQNLGTTTENNNNERCKKSPIKILIRAPTDEEPMYTTEVENDLEAKDTERNSIIIEEGCVIMTGSDKINPEEIVDKDETLELDTSNETTTTPTSSAVEFILENDNFNENESNLRKATELKITESIDDLTKIDGDTPEKCETKQEQYAEKQIETYSIPLKIDSPILRRKEIELDGMKKVPPTPPQRRRSVKEIIESINKCQRLLKINQDSKASKTEKDRINSEFFQDSTSSKSYGYKNTSINDSKAQKQYHNKKMFCEIAEINGTKNASDLNYIPVVVYEHYNSNETKTNDEKVEWNPVPKPRRHHRNSTQGSIK